MTSDNFFWLKRLMKYSAPIISIEGKPDSGKTDLACYIAEKSFELGLIDECGTNIKIDDERFLRIRSLETMNKWFFIGNALRKLFLFDEASSHIDRRNPLKKINKQFRHSTFKIRKAHGKMILIAWDLKDIESTFDNPNVTVARIRKLWRKEALITSPLFPNVIRLTDIPKTKIPFDTFDVAPFTLHEESDLEGMKGLCCQVAQLYVEIGNLSTIGKIIVEKGFSERPLKAMQVKRLLQQHLKHCS